MRLLLDTHILVWLAKKQEKLTVADRALLAEPACHFLVSTVSIWELRIKWNGRREIRDDLLEPHDAIEFAEKVGFDLVALTPANCAASLEVPIGHRDPFDEQLLIHAHQLDAKLLTRDRLLADHPLVYRFA